MRSLNRWDLQRGEVDCDKDVVSPVEVFSTPKDPNATTWMFFSRFIHVRKILAVRRCMGSICR